MSRPVALGIGATVIAALGLGMGPAQAGTYTAIEYDGATDTYHINLVAGGSQISVLNIRGNATTWRFKPDYDAKVGWSMVGTGCSQDGTTFVVTCPAASGVVVVGDLYTDAVYASGFGYPVDMYGGDGEDSLTASDAGGTLSGGRANDSLFGGPAADVLLGATGSDGLVGNDGGDTLIGGPGGDYVQGNAGADTERLGGGPDQASGGAGDDRVRAGAGGDFFNADPGRDVVHGDAGADEISGDKGPDRIYGDGGIDLLFANDQQKDRRIDCGAGDNSQEVAHHDRIDPKPISC